MEMSNVAQNLAQNASQNAAPAACHSSQFFLDDYTDCTPIADEEIANAINVLRSKRLCRYSCASDELSEVTQLEIEFAQYCGAKYALAVNSCSSAIFLMLLCSGLQAGDQVLVPAFTFIAVPSAIANAGGVPVLVECGSNYCVDLDDLQKKLQCGARFFLLSHMRGNVANLDKIVQMCDEAGVVLLEDCAHAVGVLWNGTQTGRFGKAAAFSMQAHKVLNSGEGGFLISDDGQFMLNAAIRSGAYEKNWAKHPLPMGLTADFGVAIHNFRMSNLTASVLRPQIPKIAERREIYNRKYNTLIDVLSSSPYSAHIYLPPRAPELSYLGDSIQFTLQQLSEAQIELFMQKVKATGLALSVLGRDNNNARCFWNWKFIANLPELPITTRMLMYTCDLRLPLYLEESEVRQIGKNLLAILVSLAS